MDTATVAASVNNPTAAAATTKTDSASSALTADFDMFLQLLTTQMENQDPLQPLESTEFVAQLAQFSAVEQQIAGNRTLETILETLGGSDVGALGSWLGREVRAAGGVVHSGGEVEIYPSGAPADATQARITVLDDTGFTVREIDFTPGETEVTWDGKRADGGDAPPGAYRFEASYTLPGGEAETGPAETWGRVTEARRGDAGAELTLAGGFTVKANDVSALREAG